MRDQRAAHGEDHGLAGALQQELLERAQHRAHDHDRQDVGLDKVTREHAFAATTINLIRLNTWWTGTPLQRTRTTHLSRLDLALAA
nr:hypothetical protein Ade03nite_37530 [Actinoplanes derwentensis]